MVLAKVADEQLLQRIHTGDQKAFEALVRKYESRVAAAVHGMLGSCPEAEDVGQETFIRFFSSLHRFRGESSIATYLVRIAINLSLNELKRLKRTRSIFAKNIEQVREEVLDSDSFEHSDAQQMVQKALLTLEPEFRAVVTLRLIDGFSTAETAHILAVPEGTVLSRLSRAQKKLMRAIKEISEYEKIFNL
jgi:RNA polymerase sigma-70 factor, ECF subfamily